MQSEQKWWPQEVMVRRSHTSRQMGQLTMSSPSASPGPITPTSCAHAINWLHNMLLPLDVCQSDKKVRDMSLLT